MLDVEECSIAQDASNVAELTKHMTEMADTLKNVFKKVKELRKDVQHLSYQLTEHIATCSNETVAPLADCSLLAQEIGYTEPLAALPSQQSPPLLPSVPSAPLLVPQASALPPDLMFHPSAADRGHLVQPSLPDVQCIPIPTVISKYQELPSHEINRTGLKPISEVLQSYPMLQTESKIGVLAVKLARQAFFGDETMKKCTPRGWQDLPALPQSELNTLKVTLYKQFPRYWNCPEEYEKKWVVAQEAIVQACKRLRKR